MTLWGGFDALKAPRARSAPMAESRLLRPFTHPAGWRGRVAGRLLVSVNASLYRRAVAALAPHRQEDVLEVGFGPGYGLELLAVHARSVAGVDPSEVMRRQASRRNAAALRDGRLDLREGAAEHLPWPDGSFDAVLALNNAFLWRPLEAGVAEVHRVLRPHGRALLGMHALAVRGQAPPGERSLAAASARLRTALERAGFREVAAEEVGPSGARGLFVRGRR